MKEEMRGAIYVASGAALWGMIGLFTRRIAANGLASMEIVAVRLAGAALFLAAFCLVRDRAAFHIHFRDLWMFLGTGIASFVFFNWCYFSCIQESSLSAAAVLLYTAPSFVMLMSAVLFHESLTVPKLISLAVTMLGCVLVTGVLDSTGMTGRAVVLGIGSGFGYALYSILGRVALKKYTPVQVTLWTNLCGGAAALFLTDLTGLGALAFQPAALLPEILLIICSTILPLLLYTKGLACMEAGRASIIATLEPVVAAVVGMAAFGEALTLRQGLGIALVVAAVGLASYEAGEREEKRSAYTPHK